MRHALPLALLLACAPLAAQDDPLKSPACGAALAQLQAARAAGTAVEASRSAAAAACLGSAAEPARAPRVLRPPVSVPPPQVEPPQAAAPPPVFAPAPAPVEIARPPAPAVCDAAGCWTDGGTHLRHVPPPPAGPQCIRQGSVVTCP